MKMKQEYICHLTNDLDKCNTACGDNWQGWQAKKDISDHEPPYDPPEYNDLIKLCQKCFLMTIGKMIKDA